MAAANKAELGLHPVRLSEFQGLVWVNLDDAAATPDDQPLDDQLWAQLDYRLGGDRAKFLRYGLADLVAGHRTDYTVAANWKIIQENFQECYHCPTIHPELVDTLPQFRDISKLPGYVADGRIANPTRADLEECLAARAGQLLHHGVLSQSHRFHTLRSPAKRQPKGGDSWRRSSSDG